MILAGFALLITAGFIVVAERLNHIAAILREIGDSLQTLETNSNRP